jgi:hypothetical protein
MEKIQKTINSKKFKQIFSVALIITIVGWVVFRFAAVASENARYVFNASRVAADQGAPIETLVVTNKNGILYEPLAVKNNRAYVTGARAAKLRAGQKVGDGAIKYVSKNLDLDTGMFLVRTTGVNDGLHFAEFSADGFFVPLYAIKNNTVFIVDNNVASPRTVEVVRQDSENAYIVSGLNDGDVVILSNVNAGDKVKVK